MIFLSFSFLLLSFYFAKEYLVRKMTFELSFFFAGFYFLYIPLLYVSVFGYLPIPMEFSGTRIPDIFLDKYEVEILAVSAFWFLMNFFIFFINRATPTSQNITGKDVSPRLVFSIFFFYEVCAILLFVAAGLHEGDGHWARSKEDFMLEQGTAALILVFSTAGLRLLSVALLIDKIFSTPNRFYFIACLILLAVTDLYTTGNRITLLIILFLSLIHI